MSSPLSPSVSKIQAEEQEASHDQWFRAKVEQALQSEKPRLPHDAAIIQSAENLPLMPYLFRPGRVAGTPEHVVHPNYLSCIRST